VPSNIESMPSIRKPQTDNCSRDQYRQIDNSQVMAASRPKRSCFLPSKITHRERNCQSDIRALCVYSRHMPFWKTQNLWPRSILNDCEFQVPDWQSSKTHCNHSLENPQSFEKDPPFEDQSIVFLNTRNAFLEYYCLEPHG
jgi:hypothetical protein